MTHIERATTELHYVKNLLEYAKEGNATEDEIFKLQRKAEYMEAVVDALAANLQPTCNDVATDKNVGSKLDSWEPCEYCKGERAPYQHTHSTKLFIDTFGSARTLVTECNGCPPYANCCMKDISVNSAFPIKFCPNCGRPLTPEARTMLEKRLRGCE